MCVYGSFKSESCLVGIGAGWIADNGIYPSCNTGGLSSSDELWLGYLYKSCTADVTPIAIGWSNGVAKGSMVLMTGTCCFRGGLVVWEVDFGNGQTSTLVLALGVCFLGFDLCDLNFFL